MERRPARTSTSAFGVGRREGHDSSAFYSRFVPPTLSDDETVNWSPELAADLGGGRVFEGSIDRVGLQADGGPLPDNSVALVVTSPPYFVGKEYELAVTGENGDAVGETIPESYIEYLEMLRRVFAACVQALEPGGRIAVNVANLGRKPYRSLSADVTAILQDDLGLLLRGEVIWEKSETSSGSCAWGSFAKASNPVLRDMTERVIIASKGRFSRARTAKYRQDHGLPHRSSITNDEFVETTRDVWRIDAESARRVGHPAPFPVELPRRLIDLFTYADDIVLDPFAGSGTTLVAAARTGRIGVGFDTDPTYVELAEERLASEQARIEALNKVAVNTEDGPPEERAAAWAELSFDDRQELAQSRAVAAKKKVHDLAERRLDEAGFTLIKAKSKHPGRLVEFDFRMQHPIDDTTWWVKVAGGFTSSRPGLQRADVVWKLLGQLHVAAERVLVLTPSLPKPGSPADKALRSADPSALFDVVELFDPAGRERLAAYAEQADPQPLPGFWPAA